MLNYLLILEDYVMGLFKKFLTSKSQDSNIKQNMKNAPQTSEPAAEMPEELLVAIFTACIMACEGRRLVVKAFRKIEPATPIWNQAGNLELTHSLD